MCILSQKIGDLAADKKTPCLQGSVSVKEALQTMDAYGTDIAGVACESDFVGMFRRADFQRCVIRKNLCPWETSLYEVMIADPPCVREDITVKDAYNAVISCQWGFVPVVRNKSLLAIISLRELSELIMHEYEKSESEYRMVMNYFKGGESYALANYGE